MVGAVYDRGYRGYEGERGGRAAARAALFRGSIRRALGIRRPWRQKVAPVVLLAIATVPAIVFVGVGYVTRDTVGLRLRVDHLPRVRRRLEHLLVFVALTAPDIMCPDRRQRVLPLLFARPLTGADYVLAKVGAMFAILFAFSFLPQVVLFVGQMLVSDDGALRYARDNAEVLWQVPVAVAVLSLYYAAIGVAIASLTSRRIIAGAAIIGLLLISVDREHRARRAAESARASSRARPPPARPRRSSPRTASVIVVPSGDEPCSATTSSRSTTSRRPPACSTCSRSPSSSATSCSSARSRSTNPMSGLDNGGLYAAARVRAAC